MKGHINSPGASGEDLAQILAAIEEMRKKLKGDSIITFEEMETAVTDSDTYRGKCFPLTGADSFALPLTIPGRYSFTLRMKLSVTASGTADILNVSLCKADGTVISEGSIREKDVYQNGAYNIYSITGEIAAPVPDCIIKITGCGNSNYVSGALDYIMIDFAGATIIALN